MKRLQYEDLLTGRRIVLAVTGSIAAYKAPDLVRRLRDAGAEVEVMLSRGGAEFITPLTLQAVSGRPVHQQLLDADAESGMGHIALARWADAILIAPASADVIARLVLGRADDLITAVCLASRAPLAVAPAMNQQMWQASATQDNMRTLHQRGVHCLGPASGGQACGDVGAGRMLEPMDIVTQLAAMFERGSMQGLKVMVTAGPTREAIDPVRYISNHSSGKMGYAVARAAREAGAQVTLISGPVVIDVPQGVRCIQVSSAAEMHSAVMQQIEVQDVFISAAAVADYRVVEVAAQKIKKSDDNMTLVLQRNIDIVAAVAALPTAPFTVGFAAETENVLDYAQQKLQAKGLGMIAANQVGGESGGFDDDDNALTLLWAGGSHELPFASKTRLAMDMIKIIVERMEAQDAATEDTVKGS